MLTTVWIIQMVSAVLLTVLILVHSPKGGGLAMNSQVTDIFASGKSAESGLNKLTAYVAVVFILSTLITGFQILA